MASLTPTHSSTQNPPSLAGDELGASQSTPVLPDGAISKKQDASQLLDSVLRPKSIRDSMGLEVTSSLIDLEEMEARNEEMKRTSSFAGFMEDKEDQAWLDMQVMANLRLHTILDGYASLVPRPSEPTHMKLSPAFATWLCQKSACK